MSTVEVGYEADEQGHGVGEVEPFGANSDDCIEAGNCAEVNTAECHLDQCAKGDGNDWHMVLRLDSSDE